MKKHSISIIIPAYNAEKTLEKCINSIINQTYNDYQIIVINDGSIDKTEETLNKIKTEKGLQNMQIITTPNEGVGEARNTGIKKAIGDYVFFMDADDYLENNCLKSLYNEAIKSKADIVCGNFYILANRKKHKNSIIKSGLYDNIDPKFIYEYFFENVGASVCGRLYRLDCIKNEKFNKTKMGEDVFFNIRVILNNPDIRIDVINKYVYNYYKNNQSVTYKKVDNLIDSWKEEIKSIESKDNKVKKHILGMQLYRLYNEYVHNASLTNSPKEYINQFLLTFIKDSDIIRIATESLKDKTYTMIENKNKRRIYKITTSLIKNKRKKLLTILTLLKLKYLRTGDKSEKT